MNPLLIQGFGTNITVNRRCLIIKNPHTKEVIEFSPHQINHDHIIIDGYTGNISFEAMRWIMKHGIHLTLLNWDGHLLGTWMPKETQNGGLRVNQYSKYLNDATRHHIAYAMITEKVDKTLHLLRELSKYHQVDLARVEQGIIEEKEAYTQLAKKKNGDIPRLLKYEGRVAFLYWEQLTKIFNNLYPSFDFQGRGNKQSPHNMNASDEINALLNYGYAVLEGQVRKYINAVGLDLSIGFLHEMRQSNTPLVYDLQELFRWIVDLSVLQLLEEKKLKKSDFVVTEDYNIRLREKTARMLIDKIRLNMNARVDYKKKSYAYDFVLQDNVQKLAYYLQDKSTELQFSIPLVEIDRDDLTEVRDTLLKMTPEERKKLGISKTTLWYMQKNIREGKNIKIYEKTRDKINGLST